MSIRRFAVYFVAVMACGVTAFPNLVPARSAERGVAAAVHSLLPHRHHRPAAPPRLFAGS